VGALAVKRRAGFRLLAHTADIGLEATAPSRKELFVAAAEGVKSLLFGGSRAKSAFRREVRLSAGDDAELLVVWLNEILFLCESERLVPATFEIVGLTERELVAAITGEPFDPSRHVVERSAKAVTYHHLVVEERNNGWYARVYIDL
jgi:SHS2 domain-containing protein